MIELPVTYFFAFWNRIDCQKEGCYFRKKLLNLVLKSFSKIILTLKSIDMGRWFFILEWESFLNKGVILVVLRFSNVDKIVLVGFASYVKSYASYPGEILLTIFRLVTLNDVLLSYKINGNFSYNHIAIYDFTAVRFCFPFLVTIW